MTFDEKAKIWDTNPINIERAKVFADAINDAIQIPKNSKALDFGCGTGLLSFSLKDHISTATLMDTSLGMLEVLNEKILKHNIQNFKSIFYDLENNDGQEFSESFDLVYSSMALHHIIDINDIISKFNRILRIGGYICIADVEKEDGSFHSHIPDFSGHNGFDTMELANILKLNKFEIISSKIIYEIEKPINGIINKYPIFLLIGKKSK